MAPTKVSARRFVAGVGSFVGIMLIFYVAFTANQARLPWTQPTKIRADFENIGQLQVGSQVRQNGLTVGQVSDIQLVAGRPRVTMEVNRAEPMFRDGYAGIWDQSSLALKFVELRSGDPASGPLGDAVLPVTQTESTHDLVHVLDVFDERTRAALGNSLRQLGGGMAGYGPGLHDFTASLPASLENVRTLSRTLADDRTDLPGLLRSTDRLASRFTGREKVWNTLLTQTDTTLRAIGTDDGKALGATISKLPNTLSTVRGALDAAAPPLADLAVATGDLRSGSASLGRATSDLRGVFREAQSPFDKVPDFADEAKPSVDDLKDTFAELRPFIPRLGDGIDSAVKPLQVLQPYHLDIGTLFRDVPHIITTHEGWSHHFRGSLALPNATSVDSMPLKGSTMPYPAPGQALKKRDRDGHLIPGDLTASDAGGK